MTQGCRTERFLTAIAVGSFRHPKSVLFLVLAVTFFFSLGLTDLSFQTGLLDFLPRRSPQVQAFSRLLGSVSGVTNQELVWVELDPQKAAEQGVTSITDEVAIRAQEELASFVRSRVPSIEHVFGLPHWVKLARRAGGGDLALPDSSFEFRLYWGAVYGTQKEMLSPTISGDGKATLLGFVMNGDPLSNASRELGQEVFRAVLDYRDRDEKEFDVFRDDLLVPIGLASGMARMDQSLRQDVAYLAPIGCILLALFLGLAFGRVAPVVLALSSLLLGIIWVYGLMGWLGIRLNVVNIALVPLVLGSGIDFAIHVLNELQAAASSRTDPEFRFRWMAKRAGMALFLTTTISLSGLLSLAVSDVPGIVELGLLASFAMLSLFGLILTVPAAWAGFRGGEPDASGSHRSNSRVMEKLLLAVSGRGRSLSLVLVVGISLLCLVYRSESLYQLDVIQGNFPDDDPVSKAVARVRSGGGGAFPEFLIVEGDFTDPACLAYTRDLVRILKSEEGGLGPGTQVMGPARVLGSYMVLKDGVAAALPRFAAAGGDLSLAIPASTPELRSALNTMHTDPGFAPLVKLFMSPELDRAVLIVMPEETGLSLSGAETLWNRLENVIEAAEAKKPPGVETQFFGYRTMTYLFITTSLFWMKVLFVVSLVCATLVLLCYVRRLRLAFGVVFLMFLTGLWWLGLLQVCGVYVSVFLLFPLVFLVSLGSDYALHLIWNAQKTENLAEVYGTTGKAVLFSALTDGAVFFLFGWLSLKSASQVMVATGLAVVAIFFTTVLLIPLFLGKEKRNSGSTESAS